MKYGKYFCGFAPFSHRKHLLLVYLVLVVTDVVQFTNNTLLIKPKDMEKFYDGTPLVYDDEKGYEIKGDLNIYHTVNAVYSGSQTEPGVSESRIMVVITDSDGVDVTDNYNIVYATGNLTVKKNSIVLKSGSANKVFDGYPLNAEQAEVYSGSLIYGHTLRCDSFESITDVGTKQNRFNYSIIESSTGRDVTSYYDVTCEYGSLDVISERIRLVISSGSGTWTYDGQVKSCNEWTLESGQVAQNHELKVKLDTTIVNVGSRTNVISPVIVNRDGIDVTDLYEIELRPGTLTVVSSTESKDNESLKSRPNSDSTHLFNTKSSNSGMMYFRDKSYGSYSGSSWLSELAYDFGNGPTISEITAEALSQLNLKNRIMYTDGDMDLSPYYKLGDLSGLAEGLNASEYCFAKLSDIAGKIGDISLSGEYSAVEREYRDYVYDNYTDLPFETRAAAEKILSDNNLVGGDKFETVQNILDYVAENSVYTDNYDYTDSNDVGISFLNDTNKGEFKQYATAAAILMRAADIPARYTKGYSVPADAGVWESVTSDNEEAWVEVYCDGIGWVMTEPTYETYSKNTDELVISPKNTSKVYDGTPLLASDFEIEGNLRDGDRVVAGISGMQTEIGQSVSQITSYRIENKDGVDVTSDYNIVTKPGIVSVYDESGDGIGGYGMGGQSIQLNETGDVEGGSTGGSSGPGGGQGKSEPVPVLEITCQTSGTMYLKHKSFGDYNGHGFDEAEAYNESGKINPDRFTGRVLGNSGRALNYASIRLYTDSAFLPYYMAEDICSDCNDVLVVSDSSEYTVGYYINPGYNTDGLTKDRTAAYADYYDYVMDHYTNVPASTADLMERLASENGLSASSPDIIREVAEYISGAATYNMDYEPYPESADAVEYFLTVAKEGVCRHYAMAATLMYRTLGIPARYTTGIAGKVEAGKTVCMSSDRLHAWVEVYVNNIGWIAVEVTGGGVSQGTYTSGDGRGESIYTIGDGMQDDTSKNVTSEVLKIGEKGIVPMSSDTREQTAAKSRTVMTVLSDESKTYLLKYKSFGDYIQIEAGGGWTDAPVYSANSTFNPANIIVDRLVRNGYRYSDITIGNVGGEYVVPYYREYDGTSDTVSQKPDGITGSTYTLSYIDYEGYGNGLPEGLTYDIAEAELKYRNSFVYEQYLTVPDEIREYMRACANKNGIKYGSDTVIEDVANYFRHFGTSMTVYEDIPFGKDPILYFMSNMNGGSCYHYAAAATLMYRSMGIPARYTVGYKTTAKAGEALDVTGNDAYAWVEVYVPETGWIAIDVTSVNTRQKLVFVSDSVYQVYDGEDSFKQTIYGTYYTSRIAATTGKDYLDSNTNIRVRYTSDAVQSGYGKTPFTFEVEIYDKKTGKILNGNYEITCIYGNLCVKMPLTLETPSYEKDYDGQPSPAISSAEYSIINGYLFEGHRIEIVDETEYTRTEPGTTRVVPTVKIYDSDNNDVSNMYQIMSTGKIVINQIPLTVTMGSAERQYDKFDYEPLICHEYTYNEAALLDGHTLIIDEDDIVGELYDIGTCDNTLADCTVIDADGQDVSHYYSIKLIPGKLEIKY